MPWCEDRREGPHEEFDKPYLQCRLGAKIVEKVVVIPTIRSGDYMVKLTGFQIRGQRPTSRKMAWLLRQDTAFVSIG